ncbi:MAG: MTH938/NDUFAF3 family protein [candidate division WOR-3 bacterium]
MIILGTGFGWIETETGRYEHDIIIFPDDRLANRYDHLQGSNHRLSPEEAVMVLQSTSADLVVGTGQYGVVEIPAETRRKLAELGVRLHAAPTPQAVAIYNRLKPPKCAVIHVTC